MLNIGSAGFSLRYQVKTFAAIAILLMGVGFFFCNSLYW